MESTPETDSLEDRLEVYLDERLPAAERASIERLLLADRGARDALVRVLATRALVEVVVGCRDATLGGPDCARARKLTSGYRRGVLPPQLVAELCRHLSVCTACEAHFTSASDRARRARTVLRVVVPSVLLLSAATMGAWFHFKGGDREVTASWLPLPGDPRAFLEDIIRREPTGDADGVRLATERLLRTDRQVLERTRAHPEVSRALNSRQGARSASEDEEIAFLFAFLNETRLSEADRRQALAPLTKRLQGEARPLLWRVAQSATDERLFQESILRLIELGTRKSDAEPLIDTLGSAARRGFRRGIQEILDALDHIRHEKVPQVCRDLLMGKFGSFDSYPLPDAGEVLRRVATREGRPELIGMLEELAHASPMPSGRLSALMALDRDARGETWRTHLRELGRAPDPRTRRDVARYLGVNVSEGDREILELLEKDTVTSVAGAAREALAELNARRTGTNTGR